MREIDRETKRGSVNVCAQVNARSSTNTASGLRSHAKSIRSVQLRQCMRCCIRKECWCTSRTADATRRQQMCAIFTLLEVQCAPLTLTEEEERGSAGQYGKTEREKGHNTLCIHA